MTGHLERNMFPVLHLKTTVKVETQSVVHWMHQLNLKKTLDETMHESISMDYTE